MCNIKLKSVVANIVIYLKQNKNNLSVLKFLLYKASTMEFNTEQSYMHDENTGNIASKLHQDILYQCKCAGKYKYKSMSMKYFL